MDLIADAYRVQDRQISGPDWLNSQRFDILAVIPAAQTNDQIPEMLGALLQERFKPSVRPWREVVEAVLEVREEVVRLRQRGTDPS